MSVKLKNLYRVLQELVYVCKIKKSLQSASRISLCLENPRMATDNSESVRFVYYSWKIKKSPQSASRISLCLENPTVKINLKFAIYFFYFFIFE